MGLILSAMRCKRKGGKVGRPKGRKEYYQKIGYEGRLSRGYGQTFGKDVSTTRTGSYRDSIAGLISNQKKNAYDHRDWGKLSAMKSVQRDFQNSRGRFSIKKFPKDLGTEKSLRQLEKLGDWIRGLGE
jgi:hypothetical protein